MAGLPPVSLGANLLAAFAVALLVRRAAERRWVEAVEAIHRPQRQFVLDLALGIAVGLLGAAVNVLRHGFPPESTLSLIVGASGYGFFIAVDTALARERAVIRQARAALSGGRTPTRLYSITRRFGWMAGVIALLAGFILIAVLGRDMAWLTTIGSDPDAVRRALYAVALEVLFVIAAMLALAINLIFSYARNLKLLFENETGVLERVSRGDLSRMVPVATRDEFGLIAAHTNHMIAGLRDRGRLVRALRLAEEVQRSLLPPHPPRLPGLDLAGASRYCDETGGDYFDFLELPGDRLGVVAADVAGHGIDAALFMASARAYLIAAARSYRGPAELAAELNRHVLRDSGPSGRFIGLFFLEIDAAARQLRWVRAGHEPALCFHPRSGRFETLDDGGVALGVAEEVRYRPGRRSGWEPGTVVAIATDGLLETRGPSGQLFGRERLEQAVRAHAALSAAALRDAVIAAADAFRAGAAQEDDVTLVVVKLVD